MKQSVLLGSNSVPKDMGSHLQEFMTGRTS